MDKTYLQREFIRRCRKNPSYSLRAYAKYLEIDQSFLSKILNGKRAITEDIEQKLETKLGTVGRLKKLSQKDPFLSLQEDEYEMISSWSHFAILELMKTKSFKPKVDWVAQQLGIHEQEVKDALERLQRLGFVKLTAKRWVLVSKNHVWTNGAATSSARRKLQMDLTGKSALAIENIPFEHREHASLTVAIDSRRIPELKKKVQGLLRELADYMQPCEQGLDSVYQVNLSFFPITKNE